MKLYMLTIYMIHVDCIDIMANHHLRLNIRYDFIYEINKFLVTFVDCNFFIFANYSCKLTLLLYITIITNIY
jgi:hypothetical protein